MLETRHHGPSPCGKILFTSYHCYLDPSNGAAISARGLLRLLADDGWDVRVLTGPALDFEREENVAQLLADRSIQARTSRGRVAATHIPLLQFQDTGLPAAIYVPDGQIAPPSHDVGSGYLQILRDVIDSWRPDVVITYGGYWVGPEVLKLAKSRRVKTVFWLCNLAYREAELFDAVDMTIVPSDHARDHYRDVVGVESVVAAPPINWDAVVCSPSEEKRYVTFVNPDSAKGVFVFARIAEQLQRLRPDIPLLVVEGRGGHDRLEQTDVDLSACQNIHGMDNTPDPRDFYRASRIVLMPSLCRESFGLVAAEAMINGIPVLASDRGALPEVLGEAGPTLPIPAKYTPQSREAPTAEEVGPWLDAIIRLWDDATEYEQAAARCRTRAEAWRPEAQRTTYTALLKQLLEM